MEIDDYDHQALIFLAYQDEVAVGTGRVIIKDNDAKIGCVAVSGIGSQLILTMIDHLKDHKEVKEIQIGA